MAPISVADRRYLLKGLTGEARRLAMRLSSEYDGWNVATLTTLRQYCESCQRLSTMTDDAERRRELRINMALLKTLGLPK